MCCRFSESQSDDYQQRGDPDFRGQDGPLKVEDYRTILPLTHRFVEAAQQAGHPFSKDLNGRVQEGVGYSQMTRKGKWRGSTAQTFLKQARGRPNLRVETNALASRLLFEGRHCVGVSFEQLGQQREVRAGREVLLCGGSINSPHLLQISGIGPAEHLQSIGVSVVHDLPGVGANLQDHYVARVSHRVKDANSINKLARGLRLTREVARFFLEGRGASHIRRYNGTGILPLQCLKRPARICSLLFTPASYDPSKFGELEREDGMTVAVFARRRPDSRGTILATKRRSDKAAPIITPELPVRSRMHALACCSRACEVRGGDFRGARDCAT